METITSCPACKTTDLSDPQSVMDYSISKEVHAIRMCNQCGLGITTPRPAADQMEKYYASQDYISHSDKKTSLVDRLYHIARAIALKNKLKTVRAYRSNGTLLDIGCGTGYFIETMAKNGFKVTGIEPSLEARQQAIERSSAQVIPNLDGLSKGQQFDVVTLWHVLEHVHDLTNTLKKLYARLKDDGVLFIAVPNKSAKDAIHYTNHWAAWDVPRHLFHFEPKTIRPLFARHGFDLIETRPQWFDAFYIAILSEQYKGSSKVGALLKGLTQGAISNISAFKQDKNTSSSLYIFVKSPI